jgi:hypothetical protein
VTQVDLAAQTLGSRVYQTVLFDPGSKRFSFQVAGSTRYSVVLNWTANTAEVSSEINTLATQMMGAINTKQNLDDNHIYVGGWQFYAGAANAYNTTYFGRDGTATFMNTWDKACST